MAHGEVAEWLKAQTWKVCYTEMYTRVRIPPSPFKSKIKGFLKKLKALPNHKDVCSKFSNRSEHPKYQRRLDKVPQIHICVLQRLKC